MSLQPCVHWWHVVPELGCDFSAGTGSSGLNLQVMMGLFHSFLQIDVGLGGRGPEVLVGSALEQRPEGLWMPVDRGWVQGAGRRAGGRDSAQRSG